MTCRSCPTDACSRRPASSSAGARRSPVFRHQARRQRLREIAHRRHIARERRHRVGIAGERDRALHGHRAPPTAGRRRRSAPARSGFGGRSAASMEGAKLQRHDPGGGRAIGGCHLALPRGPREGQHGQGPDEPDEEPGRASGAALRSAAAATTARRRAAAGHAPSRPRRRASQTASATQRRQRQEPVGMEEVEVAHDIRAAPPSATPPAR